MLLDSLKKTYAADPNVPQHFYRALDELIEIAQQLAHERLPANPQGEDRASPLGNLEAMRDGVSHAALVRETITLRRLRERVFPKELFADPAWDILLDLYGSHIAQHRVSVSSLCIAAEVPATTALRWITNLEDAGFIIRARDPHDGRRVFVSLTEGAVKGMEQIFDEVGRRQGAAA
ncbi:winged helix DNA-binding protein [Sphingomicrobium clamense]|uniref:Winged helix DNA-binding protein n=1 Tax=Sphingomicrobium clamense TaxID=2851013 RepID=A0ABS6V4R8_9SPHN|nr:winged helix DNA-binding protein [Sphingomicrobium sp. B8]MBW0144557.1 winged helix DNA-binding protein [Sphingomicrobium sp. B8]